MRYFFQIAGYFDASTLPEGEISVWENSVWENEGTKYFEVQSEEFEPFQTMYRGFVWESFPDDSAWTLRVRCLTTLRWM